MLVVSLGGSPSQKSRSNVLLDRSRHWLQLHGVEVVSYQVRDFTAEDLLFARFESPQIQALQAHVALADGLLIATPVYKASFSGALKTLLDVLPERALNHKVVLPIATGGSSAHMLAVDYALKPVLASLKAQEMLHGVFADDSQIAYSDHGVQLAPGLEQRLDDALQHFHQALSRRPRPIEPGVLNERLISGRWSA
ncbi:NADPH-dependent FMN reductase [Pseudomonas sp. GD03944]|uniref:NADPH-dependent FMN reductase n=1 Tax=Pseudomonas sp. GD03944 TaxID=2975409 RepID=UPI00244C9E5B|nr:NADPH-dependent FMN reductase [Pseudomonas sp. GD03944]MDH1264037.1 NADPH-dependent FMN reductase [Pseudomonas sp. GD03944]